MVLRKESLRKRIEKLREYHHDLSEITRVSFERYTADKKTKYSGERLLFLICENILDFLDHLLASRFSTVCDNYEGIISNAFSRNLLSPGLYEKLRGLGGLRNVLAHEYLNISDKEVYNNIQRIYSLMDIVLQEFETALET